MYFYPFEITTPHIVYAVLGGFVVLFGMFSLLLREKLYIGEAIWAFLFGIIIGPYGAGIFNPRVWGDDSDATTNLITLEFTRVVLAIGVFAIGVELPKAYMKKHWKSLFFLLGPVMTWGWFVSAGLIYALIPALNFTSSLAIAACLTPTDPILAAAVVGGKWADKHVPAHIRHLLAAESGCNDGAAFPFLFIALYLIMYHDPGIAVKNWFLLLWLYQVMLGIVIGALLGFGFRHLMIFCEKRDLIDRHSYVAQYVSLAILTIGVCTLLGSDDLLAAFCCGTAFAWDGFFNRQTEQSVFSSVIDLLFNVAAFIFVGAWMPFSSFHSPALTLEVWRLVVIAVLVLVLRRLPVMMVLYRWIPDIKTFREAVFSGHFGPIGIGAVFISTLAIEVLHKAHEQGMDLGDDDSGAGGGAGAGAGHEGAVDGHELTQTQILIGTMQPIVAFMVLCSIAVHGMSIPSFSLGRRVHSVSRTWSRRDTMGSARGGGGGGGGSRVPEWATQARVVRRGDEDIVINRDREDQVDGQGAEVDLERGLGATGDEEKYASPSTSASHNGSGRSGSGGSESGDTKMGLSETLVLPVPATDPDVEKVVDEEKVGAGQGEDDDRERVPISPPPPFAFDLSDSPTPISPPAEAHMRQYHQEGQGQAQGQLRPALVPLSGEVDREYASREDGDYRDGDYRDGDYRNELPPDGVEGVETIAEWKEGHHRVIERRLGPGSDVDVTVINENPHSSDAFLPVQKWTGKVHELEEGVRERVRREVKAIGGWMSPSSGASRSTTQTEIQTQTGSGARDSGQTQTRKEDSAIVDSDEDEDDGGWASDDGGVPAPTTTTPPKKGGGGGVLGTLKGRLGKATISHGVHAHKTKRRGSRRGSSGAGTTTSPKLERYEGQEGVRGRAVGLESPARGSGSGNGNGGGGGVVFADGVSPGSPARDRDRAARTIGSSRPGTGDSTVGASPSSPNTRPGNLRIEAVRKLHSRPPTRENSPSRSVRFVDERHGSGNSNGGSVGSFGAGVGGVGGGGVGGVGGSGGTVSASVSSPVTLVSPPTPSAPRPSVSMPSTDSPVEG